MSYLIVASCDSDGKITGENRAGTEAEAEATRLIMVSEGYSKAFYVEMPDGNNKYFVADLDEKTVTYNASAYNGAVAALALAKFNQERSNLLIRCDWTQASDTALSDGDKNKWIAYRKLLRDLPATDGFDAADVTWPAAP
jgi:hypothetical protein|tara:strand:+ start:685 stop:1104 length:420 start_codon:yes stop_codon:yes gene_type:complete